MAEEFYIHEFGKVFSTTPGDLEFAEEVARRDFQKTFDALLYIRDFKWTMDMEIKESPQVDKLNRFRQVGWYSKGGSVGYDKLAEHFKCHQRHVPYVITMDFIAAIINEYAAQLEEEYYK